MKAENLFLGALLLGAAVNLAAGARRPLVERAELGSNYHAAADQAAAAVRRLVPAHEPLGLVVYAGDKLDPGTLREMECDVWADYRFKWLLYPRIPQVYRVEPDGTLRPEPRYPPPQGPVPPYALAFRVTAPPVAPAPYRGELARGDGWVLLLRMQETAGGKRP